jgi:putative endonuclease
MVTKTLGDKGETYAIKLLKENGYQVIDRNFRKPWGEIDIIAIKDNVLIFVEVKTRKSTKFGFPEEAVTAKKLEKIKKVGQLYQNLHPKLPKKARVEVVSILLKGNVVIRQKIIKSS